MKSNLNNAILAALGAAALAGASGQVAATTITNTIPVGNAAGVNQNGILPYSWDGGNIGYGDAGVPAGSTKGYPFYGPKQARIGGANAMSGTAIGNIDSDKNLGWNHNTKWLIFQITTTGGYTVAVDRVGTDTRLQPAFSLFASGAQAWDAAGSSHSFNQVAGPGTGPGQSPLNKTGNATSPPYMITGGADITGFVGYANSGVGYINSENFVVTGALLAGTSTIGPLLNPASPYNKTTNPYTSTVTKGAYTNTHAGAISPAYAGPGSSVNTGNPGLPNGSGGGHVDLQLWLPAGWYAIAPGGSCVDFTCTATSGISAGANQTVKLSVMPNPNVQAPGTKYTLRVSTTAVGTGVAGKVTSNTGGINCATSSTTGCSADFKKDTTVTLTAAATNPGSKFDKWGGSCAGTTPTCIVKMDKAKSATASFVKAYALTVTKSGNGTVASTPAGINCGPDCTESYVSGAIVKLTATPAAGFAFKNWAGACTGAAACNVTMNAVKTVSAVFAPKYALNVTKPANGTVRSTPAGIVCGTAGTDCTESYFSGLLVTLTPTPAPGFAFKNWTGACTGAAACKVTMTGVKTVGAVFAALPKYALTVARPANGTVRSAPAGIVCGTGGTDCTESYTSGLLVTLTPTPATGYKFKNWTGACTGAAACRVTMNTAKSVAAVFAR